MLCKRCLGIRRSRTQATSGRQPTRTPQPEAVPDHDTGRDAHTLVPGQPEDQYRVVKQARAGGLINEYRLLA
jgi:hypothetical protein